MDRAAELELIEGHLQRRGVKRLPPRRAYICNDRTEAEERRFKRWRWRMRELQHRPRSPTAPRNRATRLP